MCGRFTQQMTWQQLHHLYSLSGQAPSPTSAPVYNGAPTQDFAVCRLDETGGRTMPGTLGIGALLGQGRQDGRAPHQRPRRDRSLQTLLQRRFPLPALPGAGQRLVRMDAGRFRQAALVRCPGGGIAPLLRPLWERWNKAEEPVESFTIITTAATPDLAGIHERQPAIIPPGRFDQWLDPASPLPQLLDLVREPCGRSLPTARRQHPGEPRRQ